MTTFSQVVDAMVTEHLRPDLLPTIAAYLNQTIREVHFKRERGGSVPILFESNRLEFEGVAAEEPVVWQVPNVTRFQRLETVYYPDFEKYAKKRHPSRAFVLGDGRIDKFYWYRSGPYIALSGIKIGHSFKLTYFEFPRRLEYYAVGNRPAVWDPENESFTYHDDYDDTTELMETAETLTTNWLLQRWEDSLRQGIRAKVFSRLGDDTRARMAYSAFESEKQQLVLSESLEQDPEYE